MKLIPLALAFTLSCASAVDNLAFRYEVELNACVELSNTREEYEQCKTGVKERYREQWKNAVD